MNNGNQGGLRRVRIPNFALLTGEGSESETMESEEDEDDDTDLDDD